VADEILILNWWMREEAVPARKKCYQEDDKEKDLE